MIVLNDSTAKSIAKAIESLGSDDRRFIGITIDEQDEWLKALEPMDDPCSMCAHEDKAGYEEPCDTCVYGHGTTCGFEVKS